MSDDAEPPEDDLEQFRIEVGHDHGVKPGNIVGAIANEAGLDGANIGHIEIHSDHSLVNLPVGMPQEVFSDLKKTRVCGERLMISRLAGDALSKKSSPVRRSTPKAKPKLKSKTGSKPKSKSNAGSKGKAKTKAKPRNKNKSNKDKGKPKRKPKP